jgi:hypothetical protein
MKKVALLLAAAFIVSAPLVAATSTQTYAAAKAKKAAKGKDAPKVDQNQAFGMALSDLFASLGKPWPAPADKGGKAAKSGGKKAKKA